ncbi:MAG: YdbH domain-containing protein, partial [Kiritimatiellae bacterium]|nr:YdbH domain-containing protein [Kiritimatiellia bacterium]
ALRLNKADLSAGFTLILDDLQLNDIVALAPPLRGSQATGRLYGRLPLRVAADGQIRLGEGFIYSPPGETGNIKVSNPEAVTSMLAQAGLPPPVCDNLAKALRNLDYDVLRFDLVNPRGDDGRVAIRLQGKSPDGKIVTPVNLSANVNGPIERFLNLAIRTAQLGAHSP